MINSYKKPEILAPCGSYDIMIAAINAGADACYFGGNKFGARAYATNFDLETSLKAIDYAHIHGTSLYLTVNTLFKDNEIDALYDYILPYYEAGLDAVIVQDLGVFSYIKKMFPGLNIHCSTQMNITSKYAARGMKELGASRIVTAREMSLEEISEIKKDMDIEIESFVHGAMCYSYSGRCLMSSLAGGRSGNRGRCAQPCRKAYDSEYLLSMKDMCTLTDVPSLIEAGIDSLKIEGRMKNEYYVASAVDAYNQIAQDYVDGCYDVDKAEKLKFKLANIYNRGGFCEGYYFMHNGPEMISKDRPNNQGIKLGKVISASAGEACIRLYHNLYKQDVIELKLNDGNIIEITSGVDGYKDTDVKLKCPKTKQLVIGQVALRTRCNNILNQLEEEIIKNNPQYPIYGEFVAEIGNPLSLTIGKNIKDDYIQITVYGNIVEQSNSKPADLSDIRAKLCQLGNTCYCFADLSLKVNEKSFVPASVVKQLRREAIIALEDKICQFYRREAKNGRFFDMGERIYKSSTATPVINVGISNEKQLRTILNYTFIQGVFMNAQIYKRGLKDGLIDKLRGSNINVYIELPYIVKNTFDIADYLPFNDIDGIYIRNIDGLFAYMEYRDRFNNIPDNFKVFCGDGLYAYNNKAKQLIRKLVPNIIFELPRELNKNELLSLGDNSNQLVVSEYQPVMLSAQCVVKNKQGCNRSNSLVKLKDDKKNVFYAQAICEECCNVIYNGIPYMILDQITDDYMKDMGINYLRLNFTIEEELQLKEQLDMVETFMNSSDSSHILKSFNRTYTSGHFNRGVE